MDELVLIADDDRDIVRYVGVNLRLEGFQVITAHDGRVADYRELVATATELRRLAKREPGSAYAIDRRGGDP